MAYCRTKDLLLSPESFQGAKQSPIGPRLIGQSAEVCLVRYGNVTEGSGLDHHGYDDGIDCVMVGDEEIDSLETVDQGSGPCDYIDGEAGDGPWSVTQDLEMVVIEPRL